MKGVVGEQGEVPGRENRAVQRRGQEGVCAPATTTTAAPKNTNGGRRPSSVARTLPHGAVVTRSLRRRPQEWRSCVLQRDVGRSGVSVV